MIMVGFWNKCTVATPFEVPENGTFGGKIADFLEKNIIPSRNNEVIKKKGLLGILSQYKIILD